MSNRGPVSDKAVPPPGSISRFVMAKIAAAKPDFVFNTINGSSNVGFIKAYDEAGFGPDNSPIISVSIASRPCCGTIRSSPSASKK